MTLFLCICSNHTFAQTASIPDTAFLSFIKSNYPKIIDTNNNLIISNAATVSGTLSCISLGISNLEGIQYFTSLTKINATGNNLTTIPDISALTNLNSLALQKNNLTYIPDLSKLQNLIHLFIYQNQLDSLPLLRNNTSLQQIIAYQNNITILPDISNLTGLLKLDVGQNQLTALPQLNGNTAFQEIICWANQIKVLPPITNLTNLTRLNAGNNLLTVTPDISNNKQLSILDLNNNFLTQGPNLSGMTNLTSVKLYGNYFSFEDLAPYINIPGFANNFIISPMKIFKGDTIEGYYNDPIPLSTGIDHSLSNITYTWREGSDSLGSVTNDTFLISQTSGINERYYYATISDPSIPSLQLETDSFLVHFNTCPQSSDFSYKATRVDCDKSGTLNLSINGYVSPNTSYTLTGTQSGISNTYSKASITELTEASYNLKISLSKNCTLNLTQPITLPYIDCKETFITPNNDGENDSYYINGPGKAVIYDKNGNVVQRVSLPYEWTGSGSGVALVPIGYYMIDINDGQQMVHVSVIY